MAASPILTTGLGTFGSSGLVITLGLNAAALAVTTHFVTLLGQTKVSRTLTGQTQRNEDLIGQTQKNTNLIGGN